MATTTTNFNFPIPQSTDLVKDGATAIAALGTSIDTDFVDLKGGTTGQLLAKASNTDLDYTWTSPNPGDITGVTAGTGISGGGTSGDVTITNSMATAIDAKGDLIAGTGADTFSRLAIGTTNGQALVADSTAATGLKWQGFAGVAVQSTASQTITNNAYASVVADTEIYDTDGYHSTTVNNTRLTVPTGKAGYYKIYAQLLFGGGGTTGVRIGRFLKNGSSILTQAQPPFENVTETAILLTMVQYLSAGDYIEIQGYQNSGISQPVYINSTNGWFGMELMGA